MTLRLLITTVALLLAGCDIPGMGPDPRIAQREADAKAIGSACRHGLRGIEDCYSLNEGASKADMFTGWKEMDQYMRENKIEGIRATVANAEPEEAVVEDPKPKAGAKDKSSETKSKVSDKAGSEKAGVKTSPKASEKAVAH
jgi:hypothetical protein